MAPRGDISSGSEADIGDSDVEYTENNNGAVGDGEKGKGKQKERKGQNKDNDQGYSWEANYVRSWDQVQEDEGGNLAHSVDDLIARKRRQRLLGPSSAIRRAIIRHLVLLVDLSAAMADRDLRPTRFELALDCARAFVVEWCEQNPLGQIGVVGMRAGIGERIVEMTGNPHDILRAIADKRKLEPAGEPSLQNAIEVARAGMRHVRPTSVLLTHLPTHSSREIVIIFGSLTTCDPGDIYETLDSCVKDKIRISLVALAAEMKICRELCQKTEGTFGVALNEGHFKDLLFEHIPPPAHRAARGGNESLPAKSASLNPNADLMLMGFPTRLPPTSAPTLNQIASDDTPPTTCQGCTTPFRTDPTHSIPVGVSDGISHLGRYRCPKCKHDFCDECDVFIHESLHVCPGYHLPIKRHVLNKRPPADEAWNYAGNRRHVVIAQQGGGNYAEILNQLRGNRETGKYGSSLGRIMNKGPQVFSTTATTNAYLDSHYTRFPTACGLPLPRCVYRSDAADFQTVAPNTYSNALEQPLFNLVLSTTMIARTFALALGALLPLAVLAGNITEGGSCSQSNTYLTPGSYQLNTDCDATTFCNSGGTCAKKRCRKDEFPFGYGTTEFKDLPRMCPSGQFCPDEEDQCQNVLPVGSACQLNRDDECEPPSDTSLSTVDNHRGAICLNYQWQNVTVGQACQVENIPYIAYSTQGEFVNIVSRGNCRKGLYCDAAQKICISTQDFGATCTADKECTSGNCLANLTCGDSTDAPRKLAVWVYVVVAIAIIGGMLLTVGTLFMIHRKERDEVRQQREQYWREQAALRQNILQMRETAQASLLSLPYNGQNQSGSGYNSPSRHSSMASGKDLGVASDDSHAGFVTNAGYAGGKGGSGLRNSLKSEDGQEATETMSMDALVTERESGNTGKRRKGGLSIGGKR